LRPVVHSGSHIVAIILSLECPSGFLFAVALAAYLYGYAPIITERKEFTSRLYNDCFCMS